MSAQPPGLPLAAAGQALGLINNSNGTRRQTPRQLLPSRPLSASALPLSSLAQVPLSCLSALPCHQSTIIYPRLFFFIFALSRPPPLTSSHTTPKSPTIVLYIVRASIQKRPSQITVSELRHSDPGRTHSLPRTLRTQKAETTTESTTAPLDQTIFTPLGQSCWTRRPRSPFHTRHPPPYYNNINSACAHCDHLTPARDGVRR